MRFYPDNKEEEIGSITTSGLPRFITEEIDSSIYNKTVCKIHERMQLHISELDIDFHDGEFQYWPKYERLNKERKSI